MKLIKKKLATIVGLFCMVYTITFVGITVKDQRNGGARTTFSLVRLAMAGTIATSFLHSIPGRTPPQTSGGLGVADPTGWGVDHR